MSFRPAESAPGSRFPLPSHNAPGRSDAPAIDLRALAGRIARRYGKALRSLPESALPNADPAPPPPIAKRLRFALERWGVAAVGWLAPRLTRTGVERFSAVLGRLGFAFDRRGRAAALENLRAAFGSQMPERERRAVALRSYQAFARNFLDLFWAQNLTAENYREFVDIEFADPGVEDLAKGGAIWVTPHYGGFEWISIVWGFRGFPFMVVAQDFKNPALTEIFSKARGVSGHEVTPQQGALLRLLRHLKRGGHAAFLTDLTVKPGGAAAAIDCFGLKTCVTILHAALAARSGLPVIPGIAVPLSDGRLAIKALRALPIAESDSPAQIAQRCWDAFEPTIRENPAPWLWMYKHWRYLPADADAATYPAYANRKKRFDKMLAER